MSGQIRLRYTYHARVRMSERDISEQEVREVLAHPDSTGKGMGDALVCKKVVRGRRLTVVYRGLSSDYNLIITVYQEG